MLEHFSIANVEISLAQRVVAVAEQFAQIWRKYKPHMEELTQLEGRIAEEKERLEDAGFGVKPTHYPWLRRASVEEMQAMEDGGRSSWEPYPGSPEHVILSRAPGNKLPIRRQAVLFCRSCKETFFLDSCPKCKRNDFSMTGVGDGDVLVYCRECEESFDAWDCPDCGHRNRNVESYLSLREAPKKKGCFIATACCDPADGAIIDSLVGFRETVLRKSGIGRWFIATYERCSPPFAVWLSGHAAARYLVRTLLLAPLARLCNRVRQLRN
jgi:hypothetical protein